MALGVEFDTTILKLLRESKSLLSERVTGIVRLDSSARRGLSRSIMVAPDAKLIGCFLIFEFLIKVSVLLITDACS